MSPDTSSGRTKHALTFLSLITECCDKIHEDCPEPTLKLPTATIRQYVRNVENPVWATHETDLEGYAREIAAVITIIEEIRDNLPEEWQDFSNWLRECTTYPEGTKSKFSTARPIPAVIFGNLDAGAKTADEPFSFNMFAKPIEKTSPGSSFASSSSRSSASRNASPFQLSLASPASSTESTPSKTHISVAPTNDGKLETILRLLQEERAARIEAKAKRAEAEMKQKQSHDEVLQRIANLEKKNSILEATTDKQKELDERAASLSKREEAVKTLRAKLEADISQQVATEKAFVAKAAEVEKAFGQMQARLDFMEKEAGARLAKARIPVTSIKKQKEPVKPKILASTSDSNDKVTSKTDKIVGLKRKPMSRVVKMLNKLYERPASERKQHVSMLIDLINFEDAVGRNDDALYSLLNATVKDSAIEFAKEGLAKWLFRNDTWLSFDEVSKQHRAMQSIKTIARLSTSLFDMNLALSSAEAPDEFDDEETSATPSEILEKYNGIFSEYGLALRHFLDAVPESSPLYALLKAHGDHVGSVTHNSWYKAVRKFGVGF
ncbi:hypothetical protein G6011_05292 [Alternaria panax]|uniref:Uncharacterized protein n=1 Tax=Alternaria panax TaxID=48097 RepID=A0AAD4I852_9PLEO|nr:hypothetical protein G6011_05292 [Alternaria panax]